MKHNCVPCDYSTNNLSNWYRHQKVKSHLRKVQDAPIPVDPIVDINQQITANNQPISDSKQTFECPHCNANFNQKSGLSRHVNHRCPKNSNLHNDLNLINELKKQSDDLADIIKNQADYIEFLKSVTSDAMAISKTSVNTLNYIVQTYPNAPPLAHFYVQRALT